MTRDFMGFNIKIPTPNGPITVSADPSKPGDVQGAHEALRIAMQGGLLAQGTSPTQATSPTPSPRLSEVATRLKARKANRPIADATLSEYISTINAFINWAGDIPIRQVTGRHISDYSHYLLNERQPGITARTLDKKLNAINALFSQAVIDSDWDKKEEFPTVGHFRFKKKRRIHTKAADNSYRAFTEKELAKVFEPKNFLSEATSPHLYWLPILSYLTGGRLNELAQLLTNDVRQHDGVWVLHINGDGHPKKRVKTDSGNRMVPLHPKLIELGFLGYVELVQTFDADAFEFPGLLFPYLTHSEKNGFGGASSTWFGRYLNRLELSDPLIVFHSLRKSFNQALINGQVHVEHRSRLLGHAFESVNTEVYGTDLPLKQVLSDFISPMEAPAVKVDLLRKEAAEFRGMLTRLSTKFLREVERKRAISARQNTYPARHRARLPTK